MTTVNTTGSEEDGKCRFNASIATRLGEFIDEDIPQLFNSIEEIRLSLVRLNHRNRLRNVDQPKTNINQSTTARDEAIKGNRYWIDVQGRKFNWMKKDALKDTGIQCKKQRCRPTHRGKRHKNHDQLSNIKKSITTFSQLVPKATQVPHKIVKLQGLLVDMVYQYEYLLREFIHCFENHKEFQVLKIPEGSLGSYSGGGPGGSTTIK
jgi:hypothetical protein